MTREKVNVVKYVECSKDEIPEGVRFDVPRQNQGQIVEVAYGDFGRAENGIGDPWKRVTDASDRSVTYYRRERQQVQS